MKILFSLFFAILTIFSIADLSLSAEGEEKVSAPTKPQVKKAPPEGSKKVVKKDPGKPSNSSVKLNKKTGSTNKESIFNAVRNRCDKNGDNAVTLAEFQQNQPPGKDEAAVEKWFHSRDINQDGKLTKQDFMPISRKKL